MAKKSVTAVVRIQIQAGAATPAPPVGTALGPHGINIMDFCKAYNAQTESQRGMVVPAEITIYEDRIVHVHHQDPAGLEAAAAGRRAREGFDRSPPGEGGHGDQGAGARDRRDEDAPTSTRSTSKAPWPRSRAPPARWASTSSTRPSTI